MQEVKTTVVNPNGIHARPASIFVQEAKKFTSKITVENVATGKSKDAKSILGIFSLDLSKPITLEIYADDCDDLMSDIKPFLA